MTLTGQQPGTAVRVSRKSPAKERTGLMKIMKMSISTRIAHAAGSASLWTPAPFLKSLKSLTGRWGLRAAALAVVVVVCLLTMTPRQQAQSNLCDPVRTPDCQGNRRVKLVFLLDRSGSMAPRGQTYNSQIAGVARALRDPAIIPRDGTVEVGVITFAEAAAVLQVAGQSLTRIDSFTTAETVAKAVEGLSCGNFNSQLFPCPFGGTSFESAVLAADVLVSREGEATAHRLLVMSTDGQTEDADAARAACRVRTARNAAVLQGLTFEFDAILIGLDAASQEFPASKARVDALVLAQDVQPPNCGTQGGGSQGGGGNTLRHEDRLTVEPQTVDTLPGATLVVNGGACSAPGATPTTADCERQVRDFTAHVRDILRQGITPLELVVNTANDTAPGTPVTGQSLSLRQALERANCRGGETTITFAENLVGETISPLVPLPAITAPGVTIDGCTGETCTPAVTIDGFDTDVEAGERHSDGLLIRTNRTTVRGLRIEDFPRAGIAIDPICPQDVTVNNLIENNVLVGNAVGVLVNDPDPETARAIEHSTGNTISQNEVSESVIPIDLGGDGETANDEGDADSGANTLLNFPDALTVVTGEGATVNASGQVSGAAAVGSTVEVFAVTEFNIVDGALVIRGVSFLGDATVDAEGAFVAEGLALSPTGIYTATVTDGEGNTSELIFDSDVEPARAIAAATTPVNFGDVNVGAASMPRPIQITNTGNAPLLIATCTLVRCSADAPDNTGRFMITGCPTVAINPGAQATVNVVFTPNACGAVSACVQFASNAPLQPTVISQLNGTGVATGQGRIILEGGGSALDFGTVGAKGKGIKLKRQPRRSFTIENDGCQPLSLTIGNFARTGADTTNGKITNPNDNQFFSVVALSSTGVESPVSNPVVLAPRETRTFRIRFNPSIPAVSSQTQGLAASAVLPDVVNSQLQIAQAGGNPLLVNLVGRVTTDVKLINGVNPTANPVVNFSKAGDIFSVEVSVFDSNLSVSRATYQFFDDRGRAVGQLFDIDLTGQLQQRNLVRGQSFAVSQQFTGAEDNSRVNRVQVTISDGEASVTATGDLVIGGVTGLQSVKPGGMRTTVAQKPERADKSGSRIALRQSDGFVASALDTLRQSAQGDDSVIGHLRNLALPLKELSGIRIPGSWQFTKAAAEESQPTPSGKQKEKQR